MSSWWLGRRNRRRRHVVGLWPITVAGCCGPATARFVASGFGSHRRTPSPATTAAFSSRCGPSCQAPLVCRGNACVEGVGFGVSGDDGARSDDAAFADCHAGQIVALVPIHEPRPMVTGSHVV